MKISIKVNEIESKAFVSLLNKFGADVSVNDLKNNEKLCRWGNASLEVDDDKSFVVYMDINASFILELMHIGEAAGLTLDFCRSMIKDVKSRMKKWRTPIWEAAIRDKFAEKHNDAWCVVAIEESDGCYVFGEINPCKPADGLKLISDNKGRSMYFGINADGEGRIEFVDMATVVSKLI